jgi:chromosome segregation ATPase
VDGESAEQRERRLVREAESRAREDAQVVARLDRHDEQMRSLRAELTAAGQERAALKQQLSDLNAAFQRSLTIAETRAKDAQDAARKQVTSRELYLTAAGVTAAIISALAAGGVLG